MVGIALTLRAPVWLWVSTLYLPVALLAQIPSGGSISGYVRDEQGGALSGAMLIAASADAPGSYHAVSDQDGRYRIGSLPPAEYVITSSTPRFATVVRENVIVRQGLNVGLDFEMSIGSVSDIVTVSGESPMLEWKMPVQAVNIGGELQRELPLSSLRLWSDFLQLTPGVVVSQARLPTYSLHGTTHASSVALVDGADATSVLQGSTLYSQFGSETVNDIQVKTGAIDAASPLGLGPVINVATRSGTNEIHGAAEVINQPKQWNASNTPGGQDLTVTTMQPDLALGGPILRNRGWFFGTLRLSRNETGNPRSAQQVAWLQALDSTFTPFDNPWQGQIGFGKVTGQISPSHQWLASYSRDVVTLGGAQSNEAGNFRDIVVGGPGAFARISSVWSPSLATRFSIGYNGKKQENRNLQPAVTGVSVHERVIPSAGRLMGTGSIAVLEASPFSGIDFNVHMWTMTGDVTYYRRWLGEHEIDAGIYLQPRRHNEQVTHYNNNGYQLQEVVLRDPANPSAGVIPFHQQIFDVSQITSTDVDSRDYAAYVQDAWNVGSRLTVTAGVRLDFIKRVDRLFDVVTQDSLEIGPRFGVTYLLTSDSRTALRASWTRVHENLTQNETQAGTNVAGFRDLYDPTLDGSFSTVFVTPPRTAISSNLTIDLQHDHQEYVDQWTAGYSRQLPGQISIDLSATGRAYRDRPAVIETNGIYDGRVFTGYRDISQNEIYRLTPNTWNWPVSTALQIAVAKQTGRLRGIAGYTREWDHLAGTWQPNDPASFLQPDAFANENGIGFVSGCTSGAACPDANSLSPGYGGGTWRSHVAHLGASYQAPWQFQVATSYTFQTGPWSGPIETTVAAADPTVGPPTVTLSNGRVVSNPLATLIRFAYPTRGDGQFKLGSLHLWNVRVGRSFPFGSRRLELALDVLNITNQGADQAVQPGGNQLFSPLFGQGSSRQFPRSEQLSVRFLF